MQAWMHVWVWEGSEGVRVVHAYVEWVRACMYTCFHTLSGQEPAMGGWFG